MIQASLWFPMNAVASSQINGHNPMRWDCERDGCFNQKRRPKIEVFSDCFPGRINFGDVDGLVEYKGCFCLLEWKGQGGRLSTGQRIAYERFTSVSGNVVFVVSGDAEAMTVEQYSVFWQGTEHPPETASLSGLKDRMRSWVRWVQAKAK